MSASGDLISLITIISAPEVKTGSGQRNLDWTKPSEFCKRRAKFINRSGREFQIAQSNFAELSWLIECRGRAAITPLMRVSTSDGRTFNILSVYSDDGKAPANADMIKIACKEGPLGA